MYWTKRIVYRLINWRLLASIQIPICLYIHITRNCNSSFIVRKDFECISKILTKSSIKVEVVGRRELRRISLMITESFIIGCLYECVYKTP